MKTDCKVIIVGAGITGIGAAYHLRENNISYMVLEANRDLGGVWYTQRWHGARCDSDFVKYSYSFRPYVSPRCLHSRDEIHAYLRSVAEEFGILDRIRFNTLVTAAEFDSREGCWTVHTNHGSFTAQFLINGNGYFSEPHRPCFPGQDDFTGEVIHTFDLDDKRTFKGKDVVLVGSGSTAVCCAPELALVSGSLTMLQRSPSYIYEIDNRATPLMRFCQYLYGLGLELPIRVLRGYLQARDDVIFVAFRAFPRLARRFFQQHWRDAVNDESLRQHFTPRYRPWEQRIPIAIGLKAAVKSGRVAMKTDEIERFTMTGIVLKSGEALKCDVCVLATGFELNFLKFALRVDGATLDMAGINFYKGIMMGGVPNYFQPVGVWHSAWTQRSESATKFAVKIMRYMAERGLHKVCIDRDASVRYTPAITPNYIMRRLALMPRLYGTYELPSVDNLLSYRFEPRAFHFG
ncbi:MAG TPA: NAD(P)/FAD-dependent oxidoreductase [Burkholderiales bacterium]|nr:NAD(P)/FAD-dependent oxidoreductase [Burkholderiales bacterium]